MITDVTGTPITYRNVSVEDLAAALRGAGLDAGAAEMVAGIDGSISRGALDVESTDFERLLGRPLVSLADAVRAAKI